VEAAVSLADAALAEVLPVVRPGVAERELAAELEYRLRRLGSESPPFATIVASGVRTALPHARPGDRRLEDGDLVLFDFGATVDGYCSDITRVFVLGRAAPWQRELARAVLRACDAAIGVIEPGAAARDVDAAARASLDSAGYGDRFGHGTGHGVGLEVHERPRINRRSADVLEAGNVVTVEPGVYLAGLGGVRLEEIVVVEEQGARVLSALDRQLREI
jgi:Xaa-Pro aminopeptidase